MHLVCVCLEGRPLPVILPLNLVPPNKRGGISEPLAIMPPPSSIGLSCPSVHSPSGPVVGGFSPTSSILVCVLLDILDTFSRIYWKKIYCDRDR